MRIETVGNPERADQASPARRTPQLQPASSLSTLKQITPAEKATKHFWNAWGWVKSNLLWIYDTILWVFQGCPAGDSPLDIMEDIIEDPKETAAECAKRPVEFAADLIVNTLLEPNGIKDLRDKNKGAFGDFLREYQSKDKTWKKHFAGKKGFDLEKNLLEGLASNPTILHFALITFRDQILAVIGEEDKKGDDENVKALRRICNGYLQKVIEKGENEPKLLVDLHCALREGGDYIAAFNTNANPKPDSRETADLALIFSHSALVLKWLEDPEKYFSNGTEYKNAGSVQFPMTYWQVVLKGMDSKHFEAVIEIVGDSFPLLTAVVQKFKGLSTKAQSNIADNLPASLGVLKQLNKDLAAPPKSEKK